MDVNVRLGDGLPVADAASPRHLASSVLVPKVVVMHPGTQHSHQAVLAAQQAGLLQRFVTSYYWRDQDAVSTLTRFVRRSRSLEVRYLRKRWNPEINPALVSSFPVYQLAARLLGELFTRTLGGHAPNVNHWADALYDRRVAAWLQHQPTPTVLHAFEGSAFWSLKAARRLGVRTILDVPSAYEKLINETNVERRRHGLARLRISKRIPSERELADVLLVASEYVAKCLMETGIARRRIAVVPYGVDVVRFSPPEQRRKSGPFRVLYVGRVGLHKGIEYLLEAWRIAGLEESELVFAGAVDPAVVRMVKTRPGNTRFIGQVAPPTLHRLYQSADVFVLPSLSDGFGMVLFEAMATGLPVIATTSCGAPVRDGLDGYVVASRDASAIAERLKSLYHDPDKRLQLGAQGRQRVRTAFTWQHYRRRVAAAYVALANGKPVQESINAVSEHLEPVAVPSPDAAELHAAVTYEGSSAL